MNLKYYLFIQIRNNDIPERMQLREVPVTPVPEGSDELDDEADWIYKQAFCKPTITTQVQLYINTQLNKKLCLRSIELTISYILIV